MQDHTITGGGGIQLYVDEAGNPNGRPILFIHGFSQCRLAWSKQMVSDLANDFRLMAMDLRGHGHSGKPRNAYGDARLWADDIHAVISTLSLAQPVLSGWAYGGVVICDYLRAYGEGHIAGMNLVGAVTNLESEAAMMVVISAFFALLPGLFSSDVEESAWALQAFLRLCMYEEPKPADQPRAARVCRVPVAGEAAKSATELGKRHGSPVSCLSARPSEPDRGPTGGRRGSPARRKCESCPG